MLTPPPEAASILAYAQTLKGGGVERVLLRLARNWADLGRRVTLVIGDTSGPLAAELPANVPASVDVRVLGDPSYSGLRAVAGIVRTVAPDLIFCPGNHYTGMALYTRLRLGPRCPPIVAKVSNRLDRTDQGALLSLGYRTWLRLHPRFIDHVVAMTPAMRDEAIGAMHIAVDRISVIPNPPAPALTDEAPSWLPAGTFLLGVGRLAPQKRWDRMIAALPRLARGDVHLVILGEGAERTALEAQAAALGLQGRVHLPGYVSDPRAALGRAAAVVLTSDFEGVPGVLREALAEGTPVVSTDSSVAVREIVTGPALGSVVAPGDEQALVAALDHWLAPGRARPEPIPEPGTDSAQRYLDLFDSLVGIRRRA
ncbi:MAG: glycosyltransferase [Sphingomonas sp.]|jgi:glycosyltransferase involved in cell wall biosynthesis|uniref:glycosyltransferase n=1 Tax=Sphingomonas sp. TaxID=28214 RepID=UPI003562B002